MFIPFYEFVPSEWNITSGLPGKPCATSLAVRIGESPWIVELKNSRPESVDLSPLQSTCPGQILKERMQLESFCSIESIEFQIAQVLILFNQVAFRKRDDISAPVNPLLDACPCSMSCWKAPWDRTWTSCLAGSVFPTPVCHSDKYLFFPQIQGITRMRSKKPRNITDLQIYVWRNGKCLMILVLRMLFQNPWQPEKEEGIYKLIR